MHSIMNTRVGDSGGSIIDLSGMGVGWNDLEGHGYSSDATPNKPMQALLKKNAAKKNEYLILTKSAASLASFRR